MKRYLRHHALFARSPNSIPLLGIAFENPPFVAVARAFWVVILGAMYLGHGNLTVNFYPTNVNNKKLRTRTSESRKRHYERRIGAAKVYLWKVVASNFACPNLMRVVWAWEALPRHVSLIFFNEPVIVINRCADFRVRGQDLVINCGV
ncbi:hypothetical protein TNIN_276111 [Trichonephila inaurata madagascariensis]|uniref:Uncharacterized protein n=1 Tax=Trichonephila inaurata madagascariensis TaxID=2747483 RepID=A0A8X6WVR7_9ARAC|nr:hypothetical protein TNIN_276111 [Trichonephila inaurata madagascariensis]